MSYDLICKTLSTLESELAKAASSYSRCIQAASEALPGIFCGAVSVSRSGNEDGALNALSWFYDFNANLEASRKLYSVASEMLGEVRHLKRVARACSLLDRLAGAGGFLGLSTGERTMKRKDGIWDYFAGSAGLRGVEASPEIAHECLAWRYADFFDRQHRKIEQERYKARMELYANRQLQPELARQHR